MDYRSINPYRDQKQPTDEIYVDGEWRPVDMQVPFDPYLTYRRPIPDAYPTNKETRPNI